jgi:hypothetical protein
LSQQYTCDCSNTAFAGTTAVNATSYWLVVGSDKLRDSP